MILKWIVCKVLNNKKEEFSFAQEEWKALKDVKHGPSGDHESQQEVDLLTGSVVEDSSFLAS